jgi:hypothetical protein
MNTGILLQGMTPHYLWNWNKASERPDKKPGCCGGGVSVLSRKFLFTGLFVFGIWEGL